MKVKSLLRVVAILSVAVSFISCAGGEVYSVKRIWGGEKYCAFTSLVENDGVYYCSFREGENHYDSSGKTVGSVRVIISRDGNEWESAALFSKEGYDLRDPHMCVMKDGTLMMIMAACRYSEGSLMECIPMVSFCSDGKDFSSPEPVVFKDSLSHGFDWLWDIKWKDDAGWSASYGNDVDGRFLRLYKTSDGRSFELVADLGADIGVEEFPNEVAVEFLPDGRMALIVRSDEGSRRGWWGTAEAPYTEWKWKRLLYSVGGPDFVPYGDGIIAVSRLYVSFNNKTAVFLGDCDGNLDTKLLLPSGGDTSYPGMILKDKELWVSYYSGHEAVTPPYYPSIYLAKIPLKVLTEAIP